MRRWVGATAVLVVVGLGAVTPEIAFGGDLGSDCGPPSDIHDGWVIASPEQQGFDAARLCAMGKGVKDRTLFEADSIVVVRHGELVYERYFSLPGPTPTFDPATVKHPGYSMTKSVVSLLVGVAVDRGLIKDLDAPVFSYFPEYADLSSPRKDRINLRNLLTMSDGLDSSAFNQAGGGRADRDPYRYILETALIREPGASFAYNNGATELIGGILQKVSGKTIDVLAKETIFAPLGIEDVGWNQRLGNGYPTASWGLSLRPRDWAKIGQLVLNRGVWQGKRIVSDSWIAQSTRAQIKAPKTLSYGFQWWLGRSSIDGRVIEWIAALGFNAQKIIIIPELDTTVVFNASRGAADMVTSEIELLDRYILTAILKR
jgi:CubicO group peptidase (beta-lactamase class C family)